MKQDPSERVAWRHPPWLKVRAPNGQTVHEVKRLVRDLQLHTVCEEAHCPNLGECWGGRTATFMLLGNVCTRNCAFCAVFHGRPEAVDVDEPDRVARAAVRLGLRHVVVTSVNRDDLQDGGARHFAATVRAIKRLAPECTVEVLVPDFRGDQTSVDAVVDSPIDIFNHNLETVPRLYGLARAGARYERSLSVLRRARACREGLLTKSGVMLGLGERREEVLEVFADLRAVDCNILTVGQYLQPSGEHLAVRRYVTPEEFSELRAEALRLGFRHVESGPLVRSSYRAWEHLG